MDKTMLLSRLNRYFTEVEKKKQNNNNKKNSSAQKSIKSFHQYTWETNLLVSRL